MKKIQTRITVLLLLTAVVVAFVNMGMGMAITQYSTTAALRKTLLETAEISALAAQNMIATYTYTISEIAVHPLLTDDSVSLQEKQAFLQERAEAYHMRSAGLADEDGYDAIHQRSVAKEPFFLMALTGQPYVSTPYITADKSDMYIVVSAPVLKNGQVTEVVYFQCDTALLQAIVEGVEVGDKGDAYILDKNGTTIAYQDIQTVLDQENLSIEALQHPYDEDLQKLAAIERNMIEGKSGVEDYYYTSDRSHNIQGYAPIPGTDGWSVAITVNQDEFMRSAHTGSLILLGLFILTFGVVLWLSITISRSIARPVVVCSERLQQLSAGDLQSPVPRVTSRDETRNLADSTAELVSHLRQIVEEFGTVLGCIASGDLTRESTGEHYPGDFSDLQKHLSLIGQKLNATIGGISVAAEQVAEDAGRLSATSNVLTRGAVDQASAVEELSATIEEINRESHHTALQAAQARESAVSAGEQMQESGRYIEDLSDAMKRIIASSDEISKIISAIENIASQTSLLSINASVEAARAGQAGKGFAVVAEEVRSLSVKSAEAAQATKVLIENSMGAVKDGSEVVDKVVQTMTQVMALAGDAVVKMENVAEAVEHQTRSIASITQGVEQISSVVQVNAASAQESAAASHQLTDQANELKRLVNNFTLRS